ncbi:MAG: ABC transporter substrate-binding protein [Atopobiaceae bacterium]|nr:ABC transporter substrate-binding protein [Atopobiaceae bacterium]MCI1319027.1 ABC transporter substrate-binding protein [Atopobiaceae bacterium]MCI1389463.1 ABC transporter substrate-binding protein [Atopobiaceae bacterium]MCI1432256.1 ABC transporter substrate-binding protein [Atopobiaceae bacterium]MCI1470714.1 ABC transporter substrate-binding protein [Atopobiaceae bacterium]
MASMLNGNMSRRYFVKVLGAAGAIGATGALAACGSSSSSSSSTGSDSGSGAAKFKLGHIGPLTGAAAIYGNATQNGAQIAVDEINAEGGDIQFDLISEDDEHDPEKSVNAYHNLMDQGMQILVGTTTTTPCVAVSTETNNDRVFELTPSASSVNVIGGEDIGADNPRKDNVFQMCFTDPNQGTASAKYISEQQLGSKIAIIYNNADAYSTGIYNKFTDEAKDLGLEIVSTSTFTDDSATDFSVQVGDAKSSGADLVFLPIYYQPASLILTEANKQGFAPKFFGVDGMDGILTVEGFDTSLAEGVMLLTPFNADADDDLTKSFVSKYKDQYGDTPNQFAADAYDCVYVIKELIENSGVTADQAAADMCDALIAAITDSGYSHDGLTGEGMTWKDTGEVNKEPKGMVIQNGAYVGM